MKDLPETIVDEILRRPREQVDETYENEPVLWRGPANHLRGVEVRGGWLRITPTRLCFRPHAINIQRQPLDIPRREITSVEPSRIFGLIKSVKVTYTGGKPQKFVVWDQEGLRKTLSV
jgi:hypothetical protein